MKSVIKMGTRGSLLAKTQSSFVALALEDAHPGLSVETVEIETKGDQIVDIPLRFAEGKDFFVVELDQALLRGEIDFTVHSMKDLSLTRPEGIIEAAIPAREDPRDIVLFHTDVLERLRTGKPIRIGSSSPRRMENLPGFLSRALPSFPGSPAPKLQILEMRGNVNTRLGKLFLSDDERKYDAVCLAVAGLSRLMGNRVSRTEIYKNFQKTLRMLLPLRLCPTAPAQGALSLQCRKGDSRIEKILRALHDENTHQSVTNERNAFAALGGGCHQRFGVTEVRHPALGPIRFTKGKTPNGEPLDEIVWKIPPRPKSFKKFDSSFIPLDGEVKRLGWEDPKGSDGVLFVSNVRAISDEALSYAKSQTVFASGIETHFKLAALGIWVSGNAEGLGEDFFQEYLPYRLFDLKEDGPWRVLTHEKGPKSIQTYETPKLLLNDDVKNLKDYTHFFWSSASRYKALRDHLPKSAHHSCGPGKSAKILQNMGVSGLQIFPSREEWHQWLQD